MKIKVYCSQCGDVEVNDDMGFWCGECGDRIENEIIISSLMSIIDNLIQRIKNIEHALRKDGFSDV